MVVRVKRGPRRRSFERKEGRVKNGQPPRWTPEEDAELRKLRAHQAGYSSSEMAGLMASAFQGKRYTRNMIIGRLNRLGLRGSEAPRQRRKKPRAGKRIPALAKSPTLAGTELLLRADGSRGESNTEPYRRLRKPEEIEAARLGSLPDIMNCAVVPSADQSFERSSFEACKWPISEDGGLHVCGKKAEIGSYCAEHAVRAYRTMPTRGRNRLTRAQIDHTAVELRLTRRLDIADDLDQQLADATLSRIADGCKL